MWTRGCRGLGEVRAAPLGVEEQAQALRVLLEHGLIDAVARKRQAERLGLDVVRLLGEY
jgi:hypothetical protein